MYLPDMFLKVLSVLQNVPGLFVSVPLTVTQPAVDGEVLNTGSRVLAGVTQGLPDQAGHLQGRDYDALFCHRDTAQGAPY